MKTLKLRLFYNKIFIGLCIVSLIFSSGHAYQTIFPTISYIIFVMALIFTIPIEYVYLENKLNVFLTSFLIFIIMIATTAIIYLGQSIRSYLLFASGIMFAFGIVLIYEFRDFVNVFLKVMVGVSVIGLIGYTLVNNTTLLDNLPLLSNVNGVYYRATILFSYITITPKRNCGMFWEPGIFATFLIYAIVFELIFKERKTSVFRLLLFGTALYTTNSTAGYVLAFMCITLLLVNRDNIKIKTPFFYLFATIFFTGALIFMFNIPTIIQNTYLSNNPILRKMIYENLSETSRTLAIAHNMNIFFENPIFGSGINFVRNNTLYISDTSTTTYLLSIYGIPAISYTLFWGYGIFKNKEKNIFVKISLFVIIMSIVNKEPHGAITFTWCILFYLLKEIHKDNTSTKTLIKKL